jgi:tetratricopeptide (TPR) repeat protein
MDPNFMGAWLGLGAALNEQFRGEDAEPVLRQAIDRYPNWLKKFDPSQKPANKTPSRFEDTLIQNVLRGPSLAYAHGKLGEVLLDLGKYQESVAHFKQCHQLGSQLPDWKYPSADYLSTAERCVELEANLNAILSGVAKPANVRDQIFVAGMCKKKLKRNVQAVKLYRDMFAANPKLPDGLFGLRLSAASAAVLAGCGQGEDVATINDAKRAELRRQALEWVAADLAIYLKHAVEPARRPMALQAIRQLQRSADFACVRDPAGLVKLPDAERTEWQKLWGDVAEILKRTDKPSAAERR